MARTPSAAAGGPRILRACCLAVALALLALAAAAASGHAATPAQQNTYSADGSVTPLGPGTPLTPSPVSVALSLTVNETHGLQPRPVSAFTWAFHGVRADIGDHVPVCTSAQINSAGYSDSGCPVGSIVATGDLAAFVYATSDPSGAQGGFACPRNVRVYNAGLHALALFIYGPADTCAGVTTLPALPASMFAGDGGGTGFGVELPDNVVHPIKGLSFAIRKLNLSFPKTTVTVARATRGYMESVGCSGATRPLKASFTPDFDGAATSDVTNTTIPCTDNGAPAATARPAISPTTLHPGDVARCSAGTWTNSPTLFAYQWLSNGTLIAQAPVANAYTVASADVGKQLTCKVTAFKGGLSGVAVSDPVSVLATEGGGGGSGGGSSGSGSSGGGGSSDGGLGGPAITPVVETPKGPAITTASVDVSAALLQLFTGPLPTISALLRSGHAAVPFRAPSAGTVLVTWSAAASVRAYAARKSRKSVVLARGTKRFDKPGAGTVTLTLTRDGRKTLRKVHSKLKITATASFASKHGATTRRSAGLTLHR